MRGSLTAQQRIERAAERMASITADVSKRDSVPALEGAAQGHSEAATRLMQEAAVVNEDGLRMTFLELAGVHAVTALACRARAEELGAQ